MNNSKKDENSVGVCTDVNLKTENQEKKDNTTTNDYLSNYFGMPNLYNEIKDIIDGVYLRTFEENEERVSNSNIFSGEKRYFVQHWDNKNKSKLFTKLSYRDQRVAAPLIMKYIINGITVQINKYKVYLTDTATMYIVEDFYDTMFTDIKKNKQNNDECSQNDIPKIKILNKLLSKECVKEFKQILTDLYRIYFSLLQSSSEIEDLFSDIMYIARNKTNETYDLRTLHINEFIKMFLEDNILKLLVLGGRKFNLPDVYRQIIDKISGSEFNILNLLENCDSLDNNLKGTEELLELKTQLCKKIECYSDSNPIHASLSKQNPNERKNIKTKQLLEKPIIPCKTAKNATSNMGIDELLDFIELKDNKQKSTNKKVKKKANLAKKSAKNCPENDETPLSLPEEDELEFFKTKLLGDSIEAGVVQKIKPNFKSNWD
jgi:hypothetical protein